MGTKILLSTVWHTGSNYVRKKISALPGHDVEFLHCEPRLFRNIKQFDRIVTTYRDPFEVGASWANRYDLYTDHETEAHWYSLWSTWRILIDNYDHDMWYTADFRGEKERSVGDSSGAHEDIRFQRWDNYYEKVPREMIEHAFDCVPEDVLNC